MCMHMCIHVRVWCVCVSQSKASIEEKCIVAFSHFSFFAWSWDSSQFGKWPMTHTKEVIEVRKCEEKD